jgi:cyclin T
MLLDGETKSIDMLSHERMCSWYFTREELEKLSPSRKDGITESKESEIRFLYCSFIRDVGVRLKLYVISFSVEFYFLFIPFLECAISFLLL